MKDRAYRFVCMLLAAMVLLSPAGAKAEFFDWFAAETPAPARSDLCPNLLLPPPPAFLAQST